MPPKKAAMTEPETPSTHVYLVLTGGEVSSIHAALASAEDAKTGDASIEVHKLFGGTINVDPFLEKNLARARAARAKTEEAKAKAKAKAEAKEKDDDDEDDADDVPKAKPIAKTAATKTKTVAEQRAANAGIPHKGRYNDVYLPANIRKLLSGEGGALANMAIVVSGIPPVMGRHNAEKLIVQYGGRVSSSVTRLTSLVVIGNKAGPAKLDKIEELGIETVDEDGLIALIEAGAGTKRPPSNPETFSDLEDSGEEEDKPRKSKKQKR